MQQQQQQQQQQVNTLMCEKSLCNKLIGKSPDVMHQHADSIHANSYLSIPTNQ
jgi:hypothetical protein